MKIKSDWIDERRGGRYRRLPESKLRTEDEAGVFVEENGMVSLFACKDLDLPSLYDATLDTEDFKKTWWGWKDTLSQGKKAFYGRLLQKKAILSAWDLFGSFYALSGNTGEEDEYLYEFKRGRLGAAGKNICQHLMGNGPTPTDALRSAVHMSDKRVKSQFDKALLDLQASFHIAKVGSEDRRWGVDVWDLLPRWIPERVAEALMVTEGAARLNVLRRYISTVGVVGRERMRRSLGWDVVSFDSTVEELKQLGEVVDDLELGDELVPAIGNVAFLEDAGLGG